jgi:transposase
MRGKIRRKAMNPAKESNAFPLQLSYQRLYNIDPVEARKELLKTLEETQSLSRTAKLWQTSTNLVRKWKKRWEKDGTAGLKNLSRRPKSSPNQTEPAIERIVVQEKKRTNLGAKRLSRHLKAKFNLSISHHTIRNILKRYNIKTKRYRTIPGFKRLSYPYQEVAPLSFFQIDTKEIRDAKTIPKQSYQHHQKHNLPLYQFTAICVRTRIRFIAYAYENTCANGIAFLILLILWLRANELDDELILQTDNGTEWGGTSHKKLPHIQNNILAPLNAKMTKILKARPYQNGMVERSHRTDDEEFYVPYLAKINSPDSFLYQAFKWVYYYNSERAHFGRGMDGMTPFQKLKSLKPEIKKQILLFPPYLLDKLVPIYLFLPFAHKIKPLKPPPQTPLPSNDVLAHYNPKAGEIKAEIGG